MDNYTISIFGNKIFFEILSETKLFPKFKVKNYDDLDLCLKEGEKENQVIIFFINEFTRNIFNKIKINNFPLILIAEPSASKSSLLSGLEEKINMPFSILDFKKRIISLIAKNEYKKNSLIYLHNYVIDKNERKIKKNNLELQLSEKEVNFLILFSEKKKPIDRNFFLKNVWKYSSRSETHTLETHIHRLRKKIFEKFGDNNFIKNNSEGYYI